MSKCKTMMCHHLPLNLMEFVRTPPARHRRGTRNIYLRALHYFSRSMSWLSLFSSAPEKRSISFPPLKNTKVGIDETPCACDTGFAASTSTA